MNMHLPPGLAVGMRIVTNDHYLKVYRRARSAKYGTIVKGTHLGAEVLVHFDSDKYPHPLSPALFDVRPEHS